MRFLKQYVFFLVPLLSVVLAADVALAAPYCLLRKHSFSQPPNCFEFYLADTAVAPPATLAVVIGGVCGVTDYAARQNWAIDPTVGGPHPDWPSGDAAMSLVGPHHQDFYGCNASGNAGQPPLPGGGGTIGPGTLLSNIGGFWGSNINFDYQITQSGTSFSWVVVRGTQHETGTGTVNGDRVSASWSGTNGSGTANGIIRGGANATRIEWSNGVVFMKR
ncbi:MAG: hypothetical protein HC900_07230 [Methylacidiphilales bacterium]|nr:hypothetical protein [Candidatus Methylacidiphilales bacterium]